MRRPQRTFAALALTALTLLAACGEGSSEEPETPTTTTGGALVEYSRTGGVAGIDERLEIQADGTGTYGVGEPEPRDRPIELTEAGLEELKGLLEAAALNELEPAQTGCADCFIYTVTSGGASAQLDDVNLLDAPGSVQQLIGFLNELAAKSAPTPR